ncbi:MAG: hypothetical protein UCP83_11600 [Intestinibacter bartlettii]|nr:hypothetical protein [Intestinibacter bartlettii]
MITKNVKTGAYTYKNESVPFNFYTELRAVDKIKFINAVCDTLIDTNYYSVIRDLVFDFQIVNVFTDVVVPELQDSPSPISIIEEFLDDTNIVEIVKANVDKKLIAELEKAVDENIEYRTGIHKNTLEDALTSLLHTVEQKINDVDTEGMMEMAMKLNSISDELTPERILQAYSETDMFKNRIYEKEQERQNHDAAIKKAATK